MRRHLWRTLVFVTLALAMLVIPATADATPPPNDDFASATVVSSLPFADSVDMTDATLEPGEPSGTCTAHESSVWYVYTPPADMLLSASVDWGFVDVYQQTGSGFDGLQPLGCGSPYYGPKSLLANAGATYYFQVHLSVAGSYTVNFSLQEVQAPANDDFANATVISSLPFSDTVDNSGATSEDGEPQACAFATQTVWYSFTPSSDVVVVADMAGSSTSATNVNVYVQTGSGFAGLSFIGCGSFGNPVQFTATAGATYYLQAETFSGNVGTLQVNLSVPPPPPFDDISNARVIPSLAFSDSGDSTLATTDPSDPSCFGQGHTVWYTFTPSEDMRIEAAVQPQFPNDPSHFTLSAYAGSPGSLTQLDCSDDSLTVQGFPRPHVEFDAQGGVPVYFMIGTSDDTPGGTFFLSVQRPLVIKTTFNSFAGVSKTGTATVSGKVTCSRPVTGNFSIRLRQVFGRLVADGSMTTDYFECTPAGTPWSTQINSSTGVLFGPGAASVSAQWSNQCDSQGCQPGALIGQGYGAVDTATIHLRRSR